ncbi:Uroporphyrinogen decarboxylase (URO-D) domain protein, partial [mine drainage metagenome]
EMVRDLPIRCLALDSMVDLRQARQRLGNALALQGNLDPHVLYGTYEEILKQVRATIQSLDDRTGFIFNLGHGIRPDVDFKNVEFLIDCVHQETRL